MLRRLDVQSAWRSLDRDFWPSDLPAGRHTVVYGHNGSGKSTLSELLLSLAEDNSAVGLYWDDETGRRASIGAGGSAESCLLSVFTRKWVGDNLSEFLDGDSASAIVTLGREAIDAKDEEARLNAEIEQLQDSLRASTKEQKAADAKVDKMLKAVQDDIISELKGFDYNFYTRNRFSIPVVQTRLRNYTSEFPDADAKAEALAHLGDGAPALLPELTAPVVKVNESLTALSDLLEETPTRVALASIEGDPNAQAWVEQGLGLHENRDNCLFCAGAISAGRRSQLAQHFDESWLEIRSKAKRLLQEVRHQKDALVKWHSTLPASTLLTGQLRFVYQDAVEKAKVEVESRVTAFQLVEKALEAKEADPSATPEMPDWSVLRSGPSATVLMGAIDEHNLEARRHDEVTVERKRVVLDHLIGRQSRNFRELEEQAEACAGKSSISKKAMEIASRRLAAVRESQFTTKDMADTLTRDLARVYGKDHLSVAVTADGKSYACRRGGMPGTDLSEGERTTLSLLYFLRKLEDEQRPGGDPSNRIVVIDDPSSSLDREALFATHQWLFDTLKGFGQYIILTHDFNLLRLFITSHKTAWRKSIARIAEGRSDEIRHPKVSFLEMYASAVNGERQSKMGKLPEILANSTSEYAYLFSMVMAGVADGADHERLFLLPNAARRVLEIFASYKAPHGPNFLRQLEILVEAQSGEPFRDVYDFCNRFSHGEGSESTDVLDARAVHGQVRRCMEFLRSADAEHFNRLCTATRVELPTF